jgi:hypothetical protein
MALLVGTALGSEVQGASVTFRWTVQGELLHAEMSAPTTGWVCVGLSAKPGLSGSLLVMGAVRNGQVLVEEHVARPPAHPRRLDLEGRPGLVAFEGEEREGHTTVRFTLRLADDDVVKLPRDQAWLTLAHSHEDDFAHHSAQRTEVSVPWP